MITRTFAFAALLMALSACGENAPAKHETPPPTVTIDTVVRRPLPNGLSASGRLVSREEVAIASELSGYRVADVKVEEGARVRAGDVLAVLDDTLLRSQIAQSRAMLAEQKVAAEKAQAEANRVEGLDNKGVLSQEAIEQRRLAANSANAAVAAAQAQLNDLLVRQRRLVIRAPRSGRILERTVRPGNTSSAGSIMFTMARDGLVELHAEVPEAAMPDIAVGDPATVALASGAKVAGTVRLLGARVDTRTGLSLVRIALPQRPDIRPGGYARAMFTNITAPVPSVPEAAIHFDANGASLLTLDKQNRAHRVGIQTGRRAGGMVELVKGPPPGTRVILSGGAFVLEGDKVRIAPKGTK